MPLALERVHRFSTHQLTGQCECTEAIENLRGRVAGPVVYRLLANPLPGVRMAAAFALSHLCDERATPYLILALRDPEP